MRLLAIDTSCDESCAAVLDTERWQLLSDVVKSHVAAMAPYGGVVPEVASRNHLAALPLVVDEALAKANLRGEELDWIAVTHRPGLIGALLVGVAFAKGLALRLGKPYSLVDHLSGHLYSPLLAGLEGKPTPAFPWIALVASGGHTELFHVRGPLDHEWLGGTLDDAAGEAFDKVGKLLGLPYPAGPVIDRLVREKASDADRERVAFPRARIEGMGFSFSGLKTAVATYLRAHPISSESERVAVAASAQEAIGEALASRLREAGKRLGVDQLVVTGGVACNSRLRSLLPSAHFPAPRHCTDNAAMIALVAGLEARLGKLAPAPWDAGPVPHAELTAV